MHRQCSIEENELYKYIFGYFYAAEFLADIRDKWIIKLQINGVAGNFTILLN